MKTATLKMETLHLIPGLSADFDQQIAALVADCKLRPGITKKRALVIEVEITPHKEDPEDVWISPVIKSKRPATTIDPIRGRRTRAGQLQFDFADAGDEGAET